MITAAIRRGGQVLASARSALHKQILRARYGDRLAIGRAVYLGGSVRVRLDGQSRLSLGDGVSLSSTTIAVFDRSRVSLGDQSEVRNLDLSVSSAGQVTFGARNKFNTLVSDARTRFIVRGGDVVTGESVFIDGGSYRALDSGRLRIGNHASIGTDTEVRAELSVRIGDYTMVAYRVSIFDTNTHSLGHQERRREVDRYPAYERGNVDRAAVDIGDDCWLGLGCAILKGARIGDRSIVGLNTTVTAGSYPPDTTIVSGEARVRTRTAIGADGRS